MTKPLPPLTDPPRPPSRAMPLRWSPWFRKSLYGNAPTTTASSLPALAKSLS